MDLLTADRSIDSSLLPSTAQLDLLAVGDHVRLGLPDGVQFWARVIEIRPGGFRGEALGTLPEGVVRCGDVCFFGREHVFGIVG